MDTKHVRKTHFYGRILPFEPGHTSISLGQLVANWEWPDVGLHLTLTVRIQESHIHVECEQDRPFEPSHFSAALLPAASKLARTVVDLLIFASGFDLTVLLEKFVNPHGMETLILTQAPNVPGLCTAYSLNNLDTLCPVVGALDPQLMLALHDLVSSIKQAEFPAVNCARAVEGLRWMISGKGNTKGGWAEMREALNFTEPYLKFITDQSTGPRHGNQTFVPSALRREVTTRAWVVMNRFLEYRKRGNTPLLPAEFPLL
jgi:hypothetical protein